MGALELSALFGDSSLPVTSDYLRFSEFDDAKEWGAQKNV